MPCCCCCCASFTALTHRLCTDNRLDLDDVQLVVHFDHAPMRRTFIHRAGRTARAGAGGESLSLLRRSEARHFKAVMAPLVDEGRLKMVKV